MRPLQYFDRRERVFLSVERGEDEYEVEATFSVHLASDGTRYADYLGHVMRGMPAEDAQLTDRELAQAEAKAIDSALNAQGGGYWS